jgi:hypothetical protein
MSCASYLDSFFRRILLTSKVLTVILKSYLDKQSKNMTQKSTLYLDEQLGSQQKAVNQGAREE